MVDILEVVFFITEAIGLLLLAVGLCWMTFNMLLCWMTFNMLIDDYSSDIPPNITLIGFLLIFVPIIGMIIFDLFNIALFKHCYWICS